MVDEDSLMNSTHNTEVPVTEQPIKIIRVHRSLVRQDMLDIFSDESILKYTLSVIIINQQGNEESGAGTGPLREIFSLFWKDCYESHMLGEIERVPYIRHDFNRNKFEAVARIIVKGYKDCQYFPVKNSKSFLVACLFGEESVTDVMLTSSFQNYASRSEADVIGKCLSQSIQPHDDELLEFLSTFDCKRRVTNDSIREVVTEITHKEIIMKPQYAADC